MKKQRVIILVLAMFFGWGISAALAGPYVSGNVGAVWLEDSEFSESQGADRVNAEFSFDTGYGITAAIGHAYSNGLRAEAEIGYRSNEIDELSGTALLDGETFSGSGSVEGDAAALSFMVNVFYDFMPTEAISPFIGAGIGVANVECDIEATDTQEDNAVFAYQAAAGVAFAVNKQVKIDLQYRYFATDDPEIENIEFEYATHNAMLGVRYSF